MHLGQDENAGRHWSRLCKVIFLNVQSLVLICICIYIYILIYYYIMIIYIMYDSISAVTSVDLLPSGVFQTYVQKNIEKKCMLRKDYKKVSFTTTYDNAMLEMLKSVQNTLNTITMYEYYNIPHGQRCTKVANVCKSQISEWWRLQAFRSGTAFSQVATDGLC